MSGQVLTGPDGGGADAGGPARARLDLVAVNARDSIDVGSPVEGGMGFAGLRLAGVSGDTNVQCIGRRAHRPVKDHGGQLHAIAASPDRQVRVKNMLHYFA